MYRSISMTIMLSLMLLCSVSAASQDKADIYEGFFTFKWLAESGRILLDVEGRIDEQFLYVGGLSGGIGSNDIGLDRNQLGDHRIVSFIRSGPKILLIEPNLRYRAVSDNPDEIKAVEEAFARSVLWGFTLLDSSGMWIDLTPFLLHDAHGVARRLQESGQGNYSVDLSRSAIHLNRTANFPDNTEFDATITFSGTAPGPWIRSVTPTADAVTTNVHHSFVRLPGSSYQPRVFDPRSGFYSIDYHDYATPIDKPLRKQFIVRHRLEKADPTASASDAVEPIVYYLDRGCPEPIKSALIDGALWWNEAFEAAGYRNAFQVRELPEGADPMDIRYNMINWVHRSTRGWSYGSSVYDPRTGEILKGHVLLGSLRVRQDYLIAQGLASPFEDGDEDTEVLVEMALARLRQLSAHEVGHTLGLMHNFAASVNDRASVMDYPHPYITLTDGQIDFSRAYDEGIGEWDKRAIIYGYQDLPEGMDEQGALEQIIVETIDSGLKYVTDADARPQGGAHPAGHLWDNGADPVAELTRLNAVRAHAMQRFGEKSIPGGTHLAYLEEVLVPLYLTHRYQVEAVSKLIAGMDYAFKVRGDSQPQQRIVEAETQKRAMEALITTLSPAFLKLDKRILDVIPPQPAGYARHREMFEGYTGVVMDPLAAAEGSVDHTLMMLMHPERLARIHNFSAIDPDQMTLTQYLDELTTGIERLSAKGRQEDFLRDMVEKRYVRQLITLAADRTIQQQVSAASLYELNKFRDAFTSDRAFASDDRDAHVQYLIHLIDEFKRNPHQFEVDKAAQMPPGSPIGCDAYLPVSGMD